MRLLLQGHLDLPQRVTLDVVLKDPHPKDFGFPSPTILLSRQLLTQRRSVAGIIP
jgi:hypothetical protein